MIINLVIAGLTGTIVPLSLVRLGIDPAVASSVFITTITDVVGFFVFLGLAAAFLLCYHYDCLFKETFSWLCFS